MLEDCQWVANELVSGNSCEAERQVDAVQAQRRGPQRELLRFLDDSQDQTKFSNTFTEDSRKHFQRRFLKYA